MDRWLKNVNPKIGYYIAGFVDGEGSFNVSIKNRKDYTNNWKLTASFSVSQKDRVVLALIKKVLGCGSIREREDGVAYFEVTNIRSLDEKVIPFFKKFGFLSANKKRNFSIFVRIVMYMKNKEHLTKTGMRKVLELRENLNKGAGRKRKYVLQDVIK